MVRSTGQPDYWSSLIRPVEPLVFLFSSSSCHNEGLQIDPCIPSDWTTYELTYRNDETLYIIHVSNPQGVNRGVIQTTLEGHSVPNGRIPLLADGRKHDVQIGLGKR